MPTLSVQQMPNGFEVETPTFWYWFKAGVAFTIGAGLVYFCSLIAWALVLWRIPTLLIARNLIR